MECLDLIGFTPQNFSSGDFSFEGIEASVDYKNGYYELKDPNSEIKYIQATKFNNADGSIILMITGYENDMVCTRYNTTSYLIIDDGKKIVEMDKDDLNLSKDLIKFIGNDQLNSLMSKMLGELRGNYLDENAIIESLYNEFFDFHYILPQKGTSIIVTLTLCDYIPTSEIEINKEDWSFIKSCIPKVSLSYDKKYIKFD